MRLWLLLLLGHEAEKNQALIMTFVLLLGDALLYVEKRMKIHLHNSF